MIVKEGISMKFQEGQRVFTPKRAMNIYPTANEKATVLAYNKEKDRYLVEFDNYVGGHEIHYKDKLAKIGKGLWLDAKELKDISQYIEDTKEEINTEINEAI